MVAASNTPQPELTPRTAIVQEATKHKDFDTDYVQPLRAAQEVQAQKEAEAVAEAARQAEEARVQAEAAEQARLIAERSVFRGSLGYAYAGGNCVDLAHAYGKNQPGNPISWYPTTYQPFIGAAALFFYNHVGVVVGIWPNGDVEIGQYNCAQCQTRFSPGELRGYF